MIFGIHQEDERCNGVSMLRPYLDLSLCILRKKTNGDVEQVDFTDFEQDRQVELEYTFEQPGNFNILKF